MKQYQLHGESASTLALEPITQTQSLPRVLNVMNLNPTDKFGSLEEQIVYLCSAFEEAGSRFVPFFSAPPREGATDHFKNRGIDAYCLNLREFRFTTLFALRALIRRLDIDVIHWHFTEPLTNSYVWWLSAVCPMLQHVYGDHISRPAEGYTPLWAWQKMLKRWLLKRYTQSWCVSSFVSDCLAEQGTWANVYTCPHFINTDRFKPNPATRTAMRQQYGVEARFLVTVVAQLIPEKGIDTIFRAMTELPEKAVLWLVGTGYLNDELQTMARTLGIADRVRFFGLQRHVEPFLQAADVFALPSRWQEAAGLVLLEAQSVGVPAIATRIGGIPEYVDDGRSGFLFPPEDARELARHLRTLCDDPDLRRRMGQQARAMAVERFSVDSRLPKWLEMYRSL